MFISSLHSVNPVLSSQTQATFGAKQHKKDKKARTGKPLPPLKGQAQTPDGGEKKWHMVGGKPVKGSAGPVIPLPSEGEIKAKLGPVVEQQMDAIWPAIHDKALKPGVKFIPNRKDTDGAYSSSDYEAQISTPLNPSPVGLIRATTHETQHAITRLRTAQALLRDPQRFSTAAVDAQRIDPLSKLNSSIVTYTTPTLLSTTKIDKRTAGLLIQSHPSSFEAGAHAFRTMLTSPDANLRDEKTAERLLSPFVSGARQALQPLLQTTYKGSEAEFDRQFREQALIHYKNLRVMAEEGQHVLRVLKSTRPKDWEAFTAEMKSSDTPAALAAQQQAIQAMAPAYVTIAALSRANQISAPGQARMYYYMNPDEIASRRLAATALKAHYKDNDLAQEFYAKRIACLDEQAALYDRARELLRKPTQSTYQTLFQPRTSNGIVLPEDYDDRLKHSQALPALKGASYVITPEEDVSVHALGSLVHDLAQHLPDDKPSPKSTT